MNTSLISRRDFTKTTLLAWVALASGAASALAADVPVKRIRTGLIGCGSVSNQYLPQLTKSPFVEVVSLCDVKYKRAKKQGAVIAAQCLATGKELLVTPEQALHVLEIITAVRESSASGQRIKLSSTFKWPIVA